MIMIQNITADIGATMTGTRRMTTAPASISMPQTAARALTRACPICGHQTRQRVIEIGLGYVTYWCSQCCIPHDVAQAGGKIGEFIEGLAEDSMAIDDLLTPQSVLTGVRVASKSEALTLLARQAASRTGQPERDIFDALVERERLGSTGVGAGIAVPHARLSGLERLCGVFLRLDRAIDFDSVDDRPVDVVFLLLSPMAAGADHLRAGRRQLSWPVHRQL